MYKQHDNLSSANKHTYIKTECMGGTNAVLQYAHTLCTWAGKCCFNLQLLHKTHLKGLCTNVLIETVPKQHTLSLLLFACTNVNG